MNIIPLNTCRSSTRGLPRDIGKNGINRSTCASDSHNKSPMIPPHFGSVNHASMARLSILRGPDRRASQVLLLTGHLLMSELRRHSARWRTEHVWRQNQGAGRQSRSCLAVLPVSNLRSGRTSAIVLSILKNLSCANLWNSVYLDGTVRRERRSTCICCPRAILEGSLFSGRQWPFC